MRHQQERQDQHRLAPLVHPDRPDHLEGLVTQYRLGRPADLDLLDCPAVLDHPDPLDLLDLLGCPDLLDLPVGLVHQCLPDHPDPLALL